MQSMQQRQEKNFYITRRNCCPMETSGSQRLRLLQGLTHRTGSGGSGRYLVRLETKYVNISQDARCSNRFTVPFVAVVQS